MKKSALEYATPARPRASARALCLGIIVIAAAVGTHLGVEHRVRQLTHLARDFSRPVGVGDGLILPGLDLERALDGLFEVSPMLRNPAGEVRNALFSRRGE